MRRAGTRDDIVLGLLDPTGLVAFLMAGVPSVSNAFRTASHSRASESEADATGLSIVARACYSLPAARSCMIRLHEVTAQGKPARAGWLDTHPSCPTRVSALELHEKGAQRLAPAKWLLRNGAAGGGRLYLPENGTVDGGRFNKYPKMVQ